MKFIKFFFLFSLAAIIAAASMQDVIVQTSFFKNHLDKNLASATTRHTIQVSEIPAEVMESLMNSPFKGLSIHEIYVESDPAPANLLIPVAYKLLQPGSAALYIVSLTDYAGQSIKATLSFDPKGKLLGVEKN